MHITSGSNMSSSTDVPLNLPFIFIYSGEREDIQ